MDFKGLLQQDNRRVFVNPAEFGEIHDVSGRSMAIILDDIEQVQREKRYAGDRAYHQGVYKRQVLFYVLGNDFGALPATGRALRLDGKDYIITDAINEDGIYSISLEAQRS